MSKSFKLALCQLKATSKTLNNLQRAQAMVREAAQNGADVIMLPEIFTTSYTQKHMIQDQEDLDPDSPNPSPAFALL